MEERMAILEHSSSALDQAVNEARRLWGLLQANEKEHGELLGRYKAARVRMEELIAKAKPDCGIVTGDHGPTK